MYVTRVWSLLCVDNNCYLHMNRIIRSPHGSFDYNLSIHVHFVCTLNWLSMQISIESHYTWPTPSINTSHAELDKQQSIIQLECSRLLTWPTYVDHSLHVPHVSHFNSTLTITKGTCLTSTWVGVQKCWLACHDRDFTASAVTRIRTWVVSATTRSTNHYTITAIPPAAGTRP